MITFSRVPSCSTLRVDKIKAFLKQTGLAYSEDIETFVMAKEGEEIIACGGLAGKVLKNIAISSKHQGSGVALKLMSHLLNLAYEQGREELFLFTKPEYESTFASCGFKRIEESGDSVVLMENHYNIEKFCEELHAKRVGGKKIGSLVMNCNPFTLGHKHLVSEACKASDWVHLFVVEEDASQFPFEIRFKLINEGLRELTNLTIHKGSEYIISKATFPTYFIKDKRKIDSLFTELDLKIFRNYLAPQLGITHRFVGQEPLCVVTNEYNLQMKRFLNTPQMKSDQIEVVELERITYKDEPISASRVRRLMKENKLEEIKHLVPQSTFTCIEKLMKKSEE